MKKFATTFGITLLVLSILLLSVLAFNNYSTIKKELETVKAERDTTMTQKKELEQKYSEVQDLLTVITPEKFKSEVATGKKMYVYIGRPDCGDCSTLEPKLVEYIKAHEAVKEELVFVNVRLLRKDEVKWNEFKQAYHVSGTPHFALWENGKQVSMTEWTNEKGFTIDMFDVWAKENHLK